MLRASVFFYHLDLQVIERDRLDEAVLPEAGTAVLLKIADPGGQPDGLFQIKFITDFFEGVKHLVRTGILRRIRDGHVLYHVIILPELSP